MNALVENAMVGYGGRYGHGAADAIRTLRNGTAAKVALAVAAPCIGLVFAVGFPVAGLAMLAWMGARRAAKVAAPAARCLANIGLFLAAPFIGLAYAVAFPFIGIGLLLARATKRAA